MYGMAADFPAWLIRASLRCSLLNKFNNIDFGVYSAPPRPFSAYCSCSLVGLLSLEHASGQGLFLIGHGPSNPAGGD